jgi:hypothetical protein
MIPRILKDILGEQASDENPEEPSALKAYVQKRIGGQRTMLVPPDKDVVEAREEETYVETDCIVDLEGSR